MTDGWEAPVHQSIRHHRRPSMLLIYMHAYVPRDAVVVALADAAEGGDARLEQVVLRQVCRSAVCSGHCLDRK